MCLTDRGGYAQSQETAGAPVPVADGSAVRETEASGADGVGDPMFGHQFSASITLCGFACGTAGGITSLVLLLSYTPGTKSSGTTLG